MPTRRHIVVVLDQDENGRMVEINRAWQYDEYTRDDGSMGQTPSLNVTQDSLERLIPDRAELLDQIARAIAARDAAESALRAERATTEQRIRDAEHAADLRASKAEKETAASLAAQSAELAEHRDASTQARLVAESAAARATEQLSAVVAERDALAARLREILEPEVFAAAYIKQVLADRGLLEQANAFAESKGLSRVWLDASKIKVTTPLIVDGLAALGIPAEKFWSEVRALRDSVQ